MSSAKRIVLASLAAVAVATLLLFTVVLPAEYGYDPLGTGERLGLVGMADAGDTPVASHARRWTTDTIRFPLAPFEGVEYKYAMHAGDVLLFNWQAGGEVLFDLHAEPEGAAEGYAESFAKGRAAQASGSYTAPFAGIHGWFWQNRGTAEVTVTLEVEGFVDGAFEFRDGMQFEYSLEDQP
ncbi:MAG: hypothetical protein HKN19_05565 [Halioglobus sp.]|nr:hypothetical protein [Halioglobus sp.]